MSSLARRSRAAQGPGVAAESPVPARGRVIRAARVACLVATGVLVVLALFNLWLLVPRMAATPGSLGVDFHVVLEHTERWLAGGSYYLDRQLHGPYPWMGGESLYPPPMALFVAPFVVLPQVVWWIVPFGLIAYALVRHAPVVWVWPLIALALWYPRSQELVLYGNPSMWAAGLVAAGTMWGWPAALVVLKPTLAPFALVGATRRSWWFVMAIIAAVSLGMLPMWPDYAKAISGAAEAWDESWDYSLRDVPLVLVPLVAWLAGRYRPDVSVLRLRADLARLRRKVALPGSSVEP